MSDRVVIDGDMSLTNTIDGEGGAFIRLGQNPVIEPLNVTENGVYAVPEGVEGFNPVRVDIPEYEGAYNVEPSTEEQTLATAGKVMTEDVVVGANELYGLWTDIVGLYAGRNSNNGYAPFVTGYNFDSGTGEVVEGGTSVLYEFLLVDENYKYLKNPYRMNDIWCYDAQKKYIGRVGVGTTLNNTNWKVLPTFLAGTRYIRTGTHPTAPTNYQLAIYRIK